MADDGDVLHILHDLQTTTARTLVLYAQQILVDVLVAWQRPLQQLATADSLRFMTHLLLFMEKKKTPQGPSGPSPAPSVVVHQHQAVDMMLSSLSHSVTSRPATAVPDLPAVVDTVEAEVVLLQVLVVQV